MSNLSELRDHVTRLEDAVESLVPFESSPAMLLMSQGLAEIRDDVHDQVREARRARLQVVLNGVPIVGHEIRVDALARLLHSLQESVSSVAQSLTGKATTRAAIPGPLREATALNLSAVFPGSFGAVLRGPAPEEDPVQPSFDFVDETATVLDDAVDRILTLIDLANSGEVNDDPIIEAVLPLGSRAFSHLAALSSAIVDEEMTATLDWDSPISPEPRTASLTKVAAQRLGDVLGRNKMSDRQTVIEGRLGTVSDLRNRVELETDEGDIVPARVVEEIVPSLRDFYTKRVQATFDVTTVRSLITGLEKNSYVLIGLSSAVVQGVLTE